VSARENAMRPLILFSVAALLSVNSGAFAQVAQPQPAQPQAAQPNPGPRESEYSYVEHGRYHPCPASVRFNGRSACLGCPTPRDCRALPSDLTAAEHRERR
jgi:hypothetical protein